MSFKGTIQSLTKAVSLRFLLATVILILAFGAFALIADEMVLEHENRFDHLVFQKIDAIVSPALTRFFEGVTFFGSSRFLLPAYIVMIFFFLFFERNKSISLNIAAVGITSFLLLTTLKLIFQRARPLQPMVKHVMGYSFPSGHSFSAFTFCGLLIYMVWMYPIKLVWRWIFSVLFFLFACAIAFSRVYLHVHFASDVIAGFCLCIIWLAISFWIMEKLNRKHAETSV